MLDAIVRFFGGPIRTRWEKWCYQVSVKKSGLPLYTTTDVERICAELAFIDVFRQLQQQNEWLREPVFPFGGAANHAFLVLLSRILIEQKPTTVVEFGAGQTSRVLSRWSEFSGARVITVEQDRHWAEEVTRHVKSPLHKILHVPLKRSRFGDYWYDDAVLSDGLAGAQADLILVDGPTGSPQWSRAGIIDFFSEMHGQEWMLLWDDLHRRADFRSFAEFAAATKARGSHCRVAFCQSSKTIGIVTTEQFRAVAHYV